MLRRLAAAAGRRCYEAAAAAAPVMVKPAAVPVIVKPAAPVMVKPASVPVIVKPAAPVMVKPASVPVIVKPAAAVIPPPSYLRCSCIHSFSTGRPPAVPYDPLTYQPPEFPYDPSTYKPSEPVVPYADFQARGIIPGEHFILAISLKKATIANAHFVQRSRSPRSKAQWLKKEHPRLRCRPHGLWLGRPEIHRVPGSYNPNLTGEYIDRLYGIIPHSLLVHEYNEHASGFRKDQSSAPYYTQVEYSCLICDMFHAVVRDIEAALDEAYATVQGNKPLYGLHWKEMQAIVFQDALGRRLGGKVGLCCRDDANGELFGAELQLKYDRTHCLVNNGWIKIPNHEYSGIVDTDNIYL